MYSKKQNLIRKQKLKKRKNRLSNKKLTLILSGTILILFGVLIGDVDFDQYSLPFYYLILIGFLLNLTAIYRFIQQNKLNTENA